MVPSIKVNLVTSVICVRITSYSCVRYLYIKIDSQFANFSEFIANLPLSSNVLLSFYYVVQA